MTATRSPRGGQYGPFERAGSWFSRQLDILRDLLLAHQDESDAAHAALDADITAVAAATTAALAGKVGKGDLFVNAGDYIASDSTGVGNGTDDTLGWQLAITAAANKVLWVPRKVLGSRITSGLTVSAPTTIFSFGAKIIPDIAVGTVSANIFNITSSDVTISGLHVDGATLPASSALAGNRSIFRAVGTSGARLANVRIENCWAHNLNQYQGLLPGSTAVWHVAVLNYCDDAVVEKCWFKDVSGSAAFVESTTNTKVLHNRITNTGWYSIHFAADNSGWEIAHNRLDGESFTRCMWGGAIDIMSQLGTAANGVTKPSETRGVIHHNILSGIHNYGQALRLASCSHVEVHSNTFYNIRGNGPLPTVRTVTDGVTTAGSALVTSATANFTASDRGANLNGVSIYEIVSSTTVRLVSNSGATATGVTFSITENPDNNIIAVATRGVSLFDGTGTTTNGSLDITAVSNIGVWYVDAWISGTGIPAGARVTAVNFGTSTLTLSLAATASATVTLTGQAFNTAPHDINIHHNTFVARGILQRVLYAQGGNNLAGSVAPQGYNIRFEDNDCFSTDTSNFFSGVFFHGQDGGFRGLRIRRNRVVGKGGASQPTAGTIGVITNSGSTCTDVEIVSNDLYCFGVQGASTNEVGIGATKVDDLTIRFNRIDNFFQAINTAATCSNLRHIYENRFQGNVGDVQPNGLVPVSGFVRRTGMSLNPGGGSIAANSVVVIALPVTGAGVGEMVVLGPPSTLSTALIVGNGTVTAANVVSVPIYNPHPSNAVATGTALWSATVYKSGT